MKHWIQIVSVAALAIGCKKPPVRGTCMRETSCLSNATEDRCEWSEGKHAFYPEPSTASIVRCKTAGFEKAGDRQEADGTQLWLEYNELDKPPPDFKMEPIRIPPRRPSAPK